jgi:hypothetical protein
MRNALTDVTADIPRGTPQHKKADLEALVHKHGGEFTQAQLSDLSAFVIAPDNKSRSGHPACDPVTQADTVLYSRVGIEAGWVG